MTSILHACPYCGYETELTNVLPSFAENPHCHRCGLSVAEADSKVDNDLAALFAHQMAMGHVSQEHTRTHPAAPPAPILSSRPNNSSPSPITYSITQHYNHSAHQALLKPLTPNVEVQHMISAEQDVTAKDILLEHNINPDSLFPSQLTLFEQANMDQRARLLELWHISPPMFENTSTVDVSTQSPPISNHSNPGCNQNRSSAKISEMHDDMMMDEAESESYDTHNAEPYVISGYEVLSQRDYNLSANQRMSTGCLDPTPVERVPNDSYKPSTDPAYKRDGCWPSSQPIEHQYGTFEMKNYYIGCGVARPHWLEDQHMY